MHFVARIVFRIGRDGERVAEFEEQLRLIEAPDQQSAYRTAKQIGHQEEGAFPDLNGNILYWQMIEVSDVILINTSETDGALIWTESDFTDAAEDYITFVKERAARYRVAENLQSIPNEITK
jgi:hypothetical protein